MEQVQALQFLDGIGMVVDPQIHEVVGRAAATAAFPRHEQGGRLHAPPVAAGFLARVEHGEQ